MKTNEGHLPSQRLALCRSPFARFLLIAGVVLWGSIVARSSGATVTDLGYLNGDNSAAAYGISDSGRTTGGSFLNLPPTPPRAFRTRPNQAVNETTDPNDNVHQKLVTAFSSVTYSVGFDIEQTSTGPIEIAGEFTQSGTLRPFWYSESGGSTTVRSLSMPPSGTSGSAQAVRMGAPSAVVGHCVVGPYVHACYWTVSGGFDFVYDYGSGLYPGQNSYATDTDVQRTVGYHGYPNSPMWACVFGTGPDLPVPLSTVSSAALGMWTIGNTSRIAGFTIQGSNTKPIVWTYWDPSQSVYYQPIVPSGYTDGVARAINDAGLIVGSVWASGVPEQACVWNLNTPKTSPVLLESVSGVPSYWHLRRAYKISSSSSGNKIVGTGDQSSPPRGFLFQW